MRNISEFIKQPAQQRSLKSMLKIAALSPSVCAALSNRFKMADSTSYINIADAYTPMLISTEDVPVSEIYDSSVSIEVKAAICNDYLNGAIVKNTKLSDVANFKTEWGTDKKYYNSLDNINREIIRVLYTVSPGAIMYSGIIDDLKKGDNKLSLYRDPVKYNVRFMAADSTRAHYVDDDTQFVHGIVDLCNGNLGLEFLTINNSPDSARMFTTNRVALYSALLNLEYSSIPDSLMNYLKTIDTESKFIKNAETWNKCSDLFKKFIAELNIRIIHF